MMIAENYLIEGIEAIETIRNSNWIIRPHEKNTCWLVPDPEVIINSSHSCSLATVADYKIEFDLDHWQLTQTVDFKLSLNPNFERKISFLEVTDSYAMFEVIISWTDGSKSNSLSRKHILYNYL